MRIIDTVVSESVDERGLRQKLIVYKQIHFCLWKVSRAINDIFGWSLIVLILQDFMEAISRLCCIWMKLNDAPDLIFLLHK